MKILILSFYYQPDLSAGSFRVTSLVDELAKSDANIEVVTTSPNRYFSYKVKADEFESFGNVKVHRITLPKHKSGMIDQINSFITFYRKARILVKNESYDIVFATSSRLFTAFLGARVAKSKGLPLYLDIRDIFTDTMKDILPRSLSKFLKPILSLIEKYTFKDAKRINLVSKGFSPFFKERYPNATYRFFTNGIDKEFISAAPHSSTQNHSRSLVQVLYAGNLGKGQGLEKIIPELAERLNGKVRFKIIGDGGQKKVLEEAISKKALNNVDLLPPVSRAQLVDEYKEADILFLHLNNYSANEKVLPSKLFEYAATGKPIWAGLSGFSAEFVKTELTNCQVFSPADAEEGAAKFKNLNLDVIPRSDFTKKFARESIISEMALDIMECAKVHV